MIQTGTITRVTDQNLNPTGELLIETTFYLTRADTFTLSGSTPAPIPALSPTFSTKVTAGTGIFSSAAGQATLMLALSKGSTWTLSGSGSVNVSGAATSFNVSNFTTIVTAPTDLTETLSASGAGNGTPFLEATLNMTINVAPAGDQVLATISDGQGDSFNLELTYTGNSFADMPANAAAVVTGGTGSFAEASGNANMLFQWSGTAFILTASGSVTTPGGAQPVITSVTTAFGAAQSSQNSWIAIQGNNLTPASTPSGGVYWSNAPSFASGRMPITLDNVSVTVNGRPGFIWWYCSAATSSICSSDQINVLAPLDSFLGLVDVVVARNGIASLPFVVNMVSISPSLLDFDVPGHVVAQHLDYTLVGPSSLFPGSSTPAHPGEEVVVWAVGFGLPQQTLVNGSASQSGTLPSTPVCTVGGVDATTTAALVSPGLYQFNVYIPSSAATGDNQISCTYQGVSTPPGNLITVG